MYKLVNRILLPVFGLFIVGAFPACSGKLFETKAEKKANEEKRKVELDQLRARSAAAYDEMIAEGAAKILKDQEAKRNFKAAIEDMIAKREAAEAKAAEAKAARLRGLYSRTAFRNLILGATPSEVLAAVGKPESTVDQTRVQYWFYRERTKDIVTDNIDSSATVEFRNGVVENVTYR